MIFAVRKQNYATVGNKSNHDINDMHESRIVNPPQICMIKDDFTIKIFSAHALITKSQN